MAESTPSLNPPCANAEGSEKRNSVEREASLFEHPSVVENVITYLGGWKPVYIARHKEKFAMISEVLAGVEERIRDDCLHSIYFHIGIEKLKALAITYDGIYSFFFRKKLNVIFTMLGLYYAFFHCKISGEELKKAMAERGVIDKVVCARWSLPKSWTYGYYTPEEKNIRVYSLGTVVEKEMSVIYLMRQTKHPCFRSLVSNMTVSYKLPEPVKCMECSKKEHLEKADDVEEP